MADDRRPTTDDRRPTTDLACVDVQALAECQEASAARRAWYRDARLCWLAGCPAPPLRNYRARPIGPVLIEGYGRS